MRAPSLGLVASAGLLAALTACTRAYQGPPRIETDMTFAGGLHVDEDTLDEGREQYVLYCRQCHGDSGRGDGPSSFGMHPPPRDFTQAQFKFGWVVNGLPHDGDLERIIRGGLHGTAMHPWDIPQHELQPIIQYIKTFAADAWTTGELGVPIVPAGPDPWDGRIAQAVVRGREVYHGHAQCSTCHPSYVTNEALYAMRGQTSFRPNPSFPLALGSAYLARGNDATSVTVPAADFTWSPLRSIRDESELEDLYKLIAAGIPGTAMPSWKGALPEDDIWAVAHYVKALSDVRGTAHAQSLREEVERQAPFTPPAEPVPATEAPAPDAAAASATGL